MKEVRKKTDRFDPARLAQIKAMINRLDNYKILFDGEDRELITDALQVHAEVLRMIGGKK